MDASNLPIRIAHEYDAFSFHVPLLALASRAKMSPKYHWGGGDGGEETGEEEGENEGE